MTRSSMSIAAAVAVLVMVVGAGAAIGLSLTEGDASITQAEDTPAAASETTTPTPTSADLDEMSDVLDDLMEEYDVDLEAMGATAREEFDSFKPWFLAHGFEDSPALGFEMTAFMTDYAQTFNDIVGFEAVAPMDGSQFFAETMFVIEDLDSAYESSGVGCGTFAVWFAYYTVYPDDATAWLAAMQLAHGLDLFGLDSDHYDMSLSCLEGSFKALLADFES